MQEVLYPIRDEDKGLRLTILAPALFFFLFSKSSHIAFNHILALLHTSPEEHARPIWIRRR